jgi:6-phosphofructokinase 2
VQPPFVRTIIDAVRAAGGRVVVDSSGPALREALGAGVCMVKPNRRELADLLSGRGGNMNPDESDPAIVGAAAIDLAQKHNITYVLVSMGGDGAVLAMKDGYAYCEAPKVDVHSATGAGDSMVAAAVLAIERGLSPEEILRDGVAAGAAATITPGTELVKRPDFERLRNSMPLPQMIRATAKANA